MALVILVEEVLWYDDRLALRDEFFMLKEIITRSGLAFVCKGPMNPAEFILSRIMRAEGGPHAGPAAPALARLAQRRTTRGTGEHACPS